MGPCIKKKLGFAGTWTRAGGFKVHSANQLHHKTILDNRNWTSDPGNYSPLLCQLSYIEINIQGGIRTREANASDLESDPFDHSGTCIIKK